MTRAMIDARPTAKWARRIRRQRDDWEDFENLNKEFQQCLLFGWEWKGVWVGWEAVVVMVPAVSVTLFSVSIGADAITKHPSTDNLRPDSEPVCINFRGEVLVLNAMTESRTIFKSL